MKHIPKPANHFQQQQQQKTQSCYIVFLDSMSNSFAIWHHFHSRVYIGHRMTWSAYHRTADIMGYLEYLAKTYPDLCSVQDIGRTKEGRALKVLRISNGNAGNSAIWIDGGIHAREWISPAAVTFLIDQFAEDWENQPAFVQSVDWYVIETIFYLFPFSNLFLTEGTSCRLLTPMDTSILTPPIDCGGKTEAALVRDVVPASI